MKVVMRFIIFLFVMASISCRTNVSTSTSLAELDSTLEELIKEAIDGSFDRTPGISLSIKSRDKRIKYIGAIGYDSKKKDQELSADQRFRIASITKTFVAAAILKLHEMDSLSIDDPISNYISEEHAEILRSDRYDLNKITLNHCLHHTSGLYDYAQGADTKYAALCLAEPNKRWSRTEQLQGAVDWGDKLGEPGDRYAYSDTGYILLGETIEYFFGGDLARGLRTLINYEKLGLNDTWLESLEEEPPTELDRVHCYLGREDVTGVDPSIDLYGGGGLVSTTEDLVKFMDGLFNGLIFDKQETLDLMLAKPKMNNVNSDTAESTRDYRCGIFAMELYGKQVYAHSGIWDVYVLYHPDSNTSIATNFTNYHRYRLIKKVVKTIDQLPDQKES